jgi:hypothetical protein
MDLGILLLAEFRKDIHLGWPQVAIPINANEAE